MAREAVGDKENRAQLGRELESREEGWGWGRRGNLARWRQEPIQDEAGGGGQAPAMETPPNPRPPVLKGVKAPGGHAPKGGTTPPHCTPHPRLEVTPRLGYLSGWLASPILPHGTPLCLARGTTCMHKCDKGTSPHHAHTHARSLPWLPSSPCLKPGAPRTFAHAGP